MKLIAVPAEQFLIKFILTTTEELAHKALSQLTPSHFGYEPTLEAYSRIAYIAKNDGTILSHYELLSDPVVSETSRKILAMYTKKVILTEPQIRQAVTILDKYRKARHLYYGAENVIKSLKQDRVDINQLIQTQYNSVVAAKSETGNIATIINYGQNNNSSQLIRDILKGKEVPAIPTGIAAFDDINRGVFLGSLFIIGSSSGGGKSVCAQTIGMNMANFGANVCFVPLEQNEVEINQRLISNLASIEMPKIISPRRLIDAEKKKITKAYKKWVDGLKRKRAKFTIWKPNEDISMEDILFYLKPMYYRVIIIDYLGLTKGVGGDDQWQKLGEAARKAKIFADTNKCIVILLAQVNDEGSVRYSKAITDHANLAWYWVRDKQSKESHILRINQRKARNQSDHSFNLLEEFQYMRVRDVPEDYQMPEEVVEQRIQHNKKPKMKNISNDSYFDDVKV